MGINKYHSYLLHQSLAQLMLVYGGSIIHHYYRYCHYLEHEKFTINITNTARLLELFIVINASSLLILIAPMAVNELASIKWFELGEFCPPL